MIVELSESDGGYSITATFIDKGFVAGSLTYIFVSGDEDGDAVELIDWDDPKTNPRVPEIIHTLCRGIPECVDIRLKRSDYAMQGILRSIGFRLYKATADDTVCNPFWFRRKHSEDDT